MSSSNLKLAFVIEAIDNATKKVRDVNQAIEKANEPTRRLRASMRELFRESGWDRLRSQMGTIHDRGQTLARTARGIAFGFSAVAAASVGVFLGLKRTIDGIDQANDVAKKLGITVEVFQRMGYAAQLNGSSAEEMGGALQFLSQNMVSAINGSQEMVLWFGRAGITMQQLRKMNAAEVFERIADKFQSVGDAGQNAEKKIALMRAMMGRGGAELKQVLDLGSEGLRTFYKEADRLGGVVDGKTADAMADFNDNFDRLKFSIGGVMATIARFALPQLDALVRRLTDMSTASRQALGEQLGRRVGELVTKLPAFLSSAAQVVGVLASVAIAADTVAQAIGGWQNVLTAVAVLVGGKLLFDIAALGVAVYGALPAFMTLSSTLWGVAAGFIAVVGWPALLAGALAAAAVAIYHHWEPISAMFQRIWGTIKSVAGAAGGWLGRTLGFAGGSPAASAATPVASAVSPAGASQLGGTLRIFVDSEGKARVTDIGKPKRGLLDFDVYSGQSMVVN